MASYLYYDLCAVLAITTLILALFVRGLTKGRNNRLFLILCVLIFTSGVLDIITEILDGMTELGTYYTMFRSFLDHAYFLIRNFCTPMYCLYVSSIIGLWYKISSRKNILHYMWGVPYAIDAILLITNPLTKKIFYFEDRLVYKHGPWIPILYLVAFYYMVLGMGILIKYRRLIKIRYFVAFMVLVPINACSVILQLFVPQYRIETFAEAVFVIAIAISVHRPEDTIDDVVGIQSHNAFINSAKINFASNYPFHYLFIGFKNYRSLRNNMGLDNYLEMLKLIAAKIEKTAADGSFSFESYYLDQGKFVIIAPKDKNEELLNVGRTILAYLQEPIELKHMEVLPEAQMCIVSCPDDISNEKSLLTFASTFQDKLPKENRVMILSQISATRDFKIRNEMDEIIRRGIEEHSFEMYYQPIYSIEKDKFVSAEALIRLKDQKYGFISPGIFIPIAEEIGAIHDIGDYVIEDVCKFIGTHNLSELGIEYIEMNLSVAQCIEPGLAEKILTVMNKYGVKPSQLNLEITETAAAYDPEIIDRNISRLKEAGLTFSLDDFGTGFSSISRIIELPFDIVKLDKTLVDSMDTPSMWIVITNTVNMLKRMKKHILVEGIEQKEAYERFKQIGCEYIQGYLFSKPLPVEDYLNFVSDKNQRE